MAKPLIQLVAVQLIKHANGLARTFPNQEVTLSWEPANPESSPELAKHHEEIAAFAERVAGSTPAFVAMSYPELWQFWQKSKPADWLARHLQDLRLRCGDTLSAGSFRFVEAI